MNQNLRFSLSTMDDSWRRMSFKHKNRFGIGFMNVIYLRAARGMV